MKHISKLLLGVMLLCASLTFAQAHFTETNLTAAITSPSATTITVASTSGMSGSPGGNGWGIYIDREYMRITAVVNSTTLQVIRGSASTHATTHASSTLAFAGPPNYFSVNDKYGSCTATNEVVLPVINTSSGNSFDCIGGLWVAGTRIGVATLATNYRVLQEAVTLNPTTISTGSNSAVAIRGLAQIASGTTMTAGYLYGTQGKLTVAGTLNGSQWTFGLVGQLDLSAATLTAGSHVGAIWGDFGATAPNASVSFADLMVLTNTTSTTLNSIIYAYAKTTNVFDFSGPSALAVTGTGTSAGQCAQTGGLVPAKVFVVKIDGTSYAIPLCVQG